MSRPTGLSGIASCYFSQYKTTGERTLSYLRIIFLGLLPIAIGMFLGISFKSPDIGPLQMYIAVAAILAAVLIGLLPIIHSIIGQVDKDREYTPSEEAIANIELNRIRVMQDLHASISWSVILLVFSLFVSVLISVTKGYYDAGNSVISSTTIPRPILVIMKVSTVILYSISASTALSFFDIVRGIFEGVENYAESIKSQISKNIKK